MLIIHSFVFRHVAIKFFLASICIWSFEISIGLKLNKFQRETNLQLNLISNNCLVFITSSDYWLINFYIANFVNAKATKAAKVQAASLHFPSMLDCVMELILGGWGLKKSLSSEQKSWLKLTQTVHTCVPHIKFVAWNLHWTAVALFFEKSNYNESVRSW